MPALVAYLDLNQNGRRDAVVRSFAATDTTVTDTTNTELDGFLPLVGGAGSALDVQGLPAAFRNLTLHLDLTNNSPDPILVNLVSPLGLHIPNLPLLFTIQPGQTFNGTFDGSSPNPVTLAPGLWQSGTTLTGIRQPAAVH